MIFFVICIYLICEHLLVWFIRTLVRYLQVYHRSNSQVQLTRLICVPVKRLYLCDTSSLALAFEVSRLIGVHRHSCARYDERRKYEISDVDFTRGRLSRSVKTYSCLPSSGKRLGREERSDTGVARFFKRIFRPGKSNGVSEINSRSSSLVSRLNFFLNFFLPLLPFFFIFALGKRLIAFRV